MIDVDHSKSVEKVRCLYQDEAISYWKGKFAKINAYALYDIVDKDNNGEISNDEWLGYWNEVLKSGYSEEEINFEVISKFSLII